MAKKRIFTFLLLILALAILSYFQPQIEDFTGNIIQQTPELPIQKATEETAILLRVIDGDTIEVTGSIIGNKTHIRMLGINTPEKKMPFSNSSSEFLKQFVNKTIRLESDKEDTDKYQRKLKYVFFEDRFLNLEIIENGFANIYYTSGLIYEQAFISAEKQARLMETGFWKKSQEKCSTENCISLKYFNDKEEVFILENICEFDCNLDGWFLKDTGRNVFWLSNLSSNQEKTYLSSSIKEAEIWQAHDKLFLFDKKGFIVFFQEY